MTTATERSIASVFDDNEVGKFVLKRIEAADVDLEAEDRDEMKPFKEEGDFEPLGSVGSLYDILREADENYGPLEKISASHPHPQLKPKPAKTAKPQKDLHSGSVEAENTSAPHQRPQLKPKPALARLPPTPQPQPRAKTTIPHNQLPSESHLSSVPHQRPELKPKPTLASLPPPPKPQAEAKHIEPHEGLNSEGLETKRSQDSKQGSQEEESLQTADHVKPTQLAEKPSRAQRRRAGRRAAAAAGESLMDKFQNFTTSPPSSHEWGEGRLV